MVSGIQNISFSGIYDFKVPKGTSQSVINHVADETKSIICQQFNKDDVHDAGFEVAAMNDRMRIVTSTDNPWLIAWLMKSIGGEKLAKDFVRKNIQEYSLNIQV